MKSFACLLLLSDNTSLIHKKHGRQIGSRYTPVVAYTCILRVYVNQ